MNERIKLLAEQAGITTNLDTDYFEKDMNKWVDYFSEKLAELIVRECKRAIDPTGDLTSMSEAGWRKACMKMIDEHFGVEEK